MELRCYLGICIITDGRHWCQCRQVAASSGHQSTDSLTQPPVGPVAAPLTHGDTLALVRL